MTLSLALFRHNQSFTLILLLALILFLWIPDFIHPLVIEYKGMPLYNIVEWLTFNSSFLGPIIAFIIVIIQGIYINLFVSRHDLIIRSSYIPSLLYILMASILPDFRSLSPALISNVFLLLACDHLLSMYKQKTIDNLIFNASLLISVASLFSFQAISFYAVAIGALIIFRPFSWREWMISLAGLIVPYIFLITWLIVFDQQETINNLYSIPVNHTSNAISPLNRNILGAIILLSVIIAYLKITTYLNSTTVKIKKGYSLLTWLIVISLISFLIFHVQANRRFICLSIPVSIILSNYFLLSAKSFMAELLFILLLAAATFVQISYL